jgi:hypothetical protein
VTHLLLNQVIHSKKNKINDPSFESKWFGKG